MPGGGIRPFRKTGPVEGLPRPSDRRRRSEVAYHGGMDNFWVAAAWSILPTLGVSAIFFMVLRGILRFDRTERKVHAQIEAEERAARGLPPRS